MYECSSCKLTCLYRLRFQGGCSHTLCSDCTVKFMWQNTGPGGHMFTCCRCCHESYCPICFLRAPGGVVTETWSPPEVIIFPTDDPTAATVGNVTTENMTTVTTSPNTFQDQ